jgi:hypothetical protein
MLPPAEPISGASDAHIAFTLVTVVPLSQPKCPRIFTLFAASLVVDAVRVGKLRLGIILLDR